LKVKLCDARLRIAYQLILEKDRMALIVIVTHEDDEV